MNEQRQQAYLNLIQTLLNCPNGEEPEILAANTELLDAGFVQVILKMASNLIQQSELDQANHLMNIAAHLLGVYDNLLSITTATQQQYLNFLLQILQATADSNGDPQVIYPLLRANTDKLNLIFAELLHYWATNTLAEAELDTRISIAAVIGDFSNQISQCHFASKANNMEIAITGYKMALTVYTRSAFPQQWAMTQNNLGNAYSNRIKGAPAENIELAIKAYTDALEVRTCKTLPVDWAMTQNHLGVAYHNRIKGDPAENIELAIKAYTNALGVRTRKAFPQQWAATQDHLGTAYYKRIEGNRAENIELAIKAYKDALEVRNHETLPEEWAMTQDNLGNAYSEKIFGDRVENIELAIKAYINALKVRTREELPLDWAATPNNLGLAYYSRIKENRAENIELAIKAYINALKVRTREELPLDWAATQNNLGLAYIDRIKEEKADNIENAISIYTANLEVYTRETLPQQWAITQNNLGIAYVERIKGDPAENVELAIKAYINALKVRTRKELPLDWAATQNNLGIAYRNRIKGDEEDNIESAIRVFGAALEVYNRTTFPQEHLETLYNLATLYLENGRYTLADDALKPSIEIVELLRQEIISTYKTNIKLAEKYNVLYTKIVEICLKIRDVNEGLDYVERSKTRNLIELIFDRDSKTIFPLEVVTQLEKLRNEIASSQYQLQNSKAENPTALAQHIQQLRQQRQELQDSYLSVGSSFKFDQFQETLDTNTAIIEWYIASDRILAFIIKPHGQKLTVWQSQPEDLDALSIWVNEYLGDYYRQKDKWRNQLKERLKELANILHIEEILNLAQIPKDYKLILIPHRFLHLFPLHTLPVGESCLIDLFPNGVSYAPSCQILQQVQQRKRPNFQSLFAIQNPTGDLNYTDLEVQVIQSYFNPANVLKKAAATLTAINNFDLNTYHCAHFSCHGYFNLTNASKSALILANSPVADTPTKPDSERYLNVRAGRTCKRKPHPFAAPFYWAGFTATGL